MNGQQAEDVLIDEISGLVSKHRPDEAMFVEDCVRNPGDGAKEHIFAIPSGGEVFSFSDWATKVVIYLAAGLLQDVVEPILQKAAKSALDWLRRQFGWLRRQFGVKPKSATQQEMLGKIRVLLEEEGWSPNDAEIISEEILSTAKRTSERFLVLARKE